MNEQLPFFIALGVLLIVLIGLLVRTMNREATGEREYQEWAKAHGVNRVRERER